MNEKRTQRWRVITLAILFVGYSGYYVCRSNLSVVGTLIARDSDGLISLTEIGWLYSIGTYCYALGKISNGILADFLDGRRIFLLGMFASIICTVAFASGESFAVFAVVWGINRYVQSMGWGAMVKISSRWFPVSVHATVMGILSLSYLFGDAIGRTYLGIFIRLGVDWRGIFFIAAATLAVVALATAFFLKSSPRDVGLEEPPADPTNVFAADGEKARPASIWRLLLPLFANQAFWLACGMNVGLTLIRQSLTDWIPAYLTDELHFDEGVSAQFSSLFPLSGAAAALLGGRLSDRLNGRHTLIALPSLGLLSLSLLLLGLLPLAGQTILTLVLISAVSFFLMAPYSFCSGLIAINLGGKQGSSTAAGFIDAAGYFGASAFGFGIVPVKDYLGWPFVFLLLAVAAILTAVISCLYWLCLQPTHVPETAQS